jgi:hypothetical protein
MARSSLVPLCLAALGPALLASCGGRGAGGAGSTAAAPLPVNVIGRWQGRSQGGGVVSRGVLSRASGG